MMKMLLQCNTRFSTQKHTSLESISEESVTSPLLDAFQNNIAREFKRLFGDIAKFSNGNMFVCVDGRWKVDEYNVYITRLINKFSDNVTYDREKLVKYNGDGNNFVSRIKVLTSVLEKIQGGLGNKFTDLFRSELYDENFHKLVDADLDLIGFNNGIFNLKTNEFMPYSKEYIVTKSTGYDFDDTNLDLKTDVVQFLREVFPDNDLHEYMLTTLSSCLDGKNREETLSFWTGISSKQTGSNGKSTLCNLLSAAFGDYFLNGHPSIITGKIEKAQSANLPVYELKGKRLVMFQEIETEDDNSTATVNMAKLKSYSGNDVSITARTL